MAQYRKVHQLLTCDAAYIAGLIDGEGTVSLTRKHSNENRQLVVSIGNTERPLLEYVRTTVGAGRITNKRTYSDNHTPSFTYTVTNRQALSLLEQIEPFLRTYKAERTRMLLESYLRLTPRNGKYTESLIEERERFIKVFFGLGSR